MTKEFKLDTLLVFVCRSHQNVISRVFSKLKLPRGQPPVLFNLEDHEGDCSGRSGEKTGNYRRQQ